MMRPVQAAGTALKGNLKNLGGIAAREKAELTHRRPKQSRNRGMLRPCKMHRAGVIGNVTVQHAQIGGQLGQRQGAGQVVQERIALEF